MRSGACYIRVSTEEQTEFSPDAQLKAILSYAKNNSIEIDESHIYIDEGISGRCAQKRPAFLAMIASAKSKPRPFDIILVHKFDRFARSREDSVVYKSLLKKEAGIKVLSITETIDDDKFSVILEAMLEAMAEYYSLNLADEVKKGMSEKALRGEYQASPPLGYRMENKKLAVVRDEAQYVKYIFEQFANANMPLRALAEQLNNLGIRTKRGNPFENRTLEYILQNPIYAGNVRWTPSGRTYRNFNNPKSITAHGEHDAIIDFDLWEKTQRKLAAQKETYRGQKRKAKMHTWLKGLVRCGSCGGVMVSNGTKYMQCSKYSKGACKKSHSIAIKALEECVLSALKETFQEPLELRVTNTVSSDIESEIKLLEAHRERLEYTKKRAKEAFLSGIDTLLEYEENKSEIAKGLFYASERLKKLSAVPTEQKRKVAISDIYSFFINENVSLSAKHMAAHFLIEKITYEKERGKIIIIYS